MIDRVGLHRGEGGDHVESVRHPGLRFISKCNQADARRRHPCLDVQSWIEIVIFYRALCIN